MPRQRFIWPSFWDDPDTAKLPADERLFFVGLFSLADDEGRLLGELAWLRSHIWQYHDVTLEFVRRVRDSVVKANSNVILYRVDGIDYIALLKWKEYQKPKYPTPSKFPPPPEPTTAALPKDSGNVTAALPKDSGSLPGSLLKNSAMGWDGLGRDELGKRDDDARAREAAPQNFAAAVPDERADDTPARRQVIEHYCRAMQRTPFTVSEDDRRDIEAALELTGGDAAPIIAAIDALLERRKHGRKRNEPIASFAYFLHTFQRQAPAEIAAARDSPSGKGRPRKNGGVTRGTKGGAPGVYDDGEYAGVFGDG